MSHDFHDMNAAPAQGPEAPSAPSWHAEARTLFGRGVSIAVIARRFGVAYATAQWAVDPKFVQRRRERDAIRLEMQRVERGPRAVKYHPETRAEIVRAKSVMSAREVAAQFGITRDAVLGIWHRHGGRS